MAKVKPTTSTKSSNKKGRPALTPEARENQLISLAIDLVEQRLIDGTATSQETTHFLKLASSKNRLEQEKLRAETELAKAKVAAIEDNKNTQQAYLDAINAMRYYSGHGGGPDDEDY